MLIEIYCNTCKKKIGEVDKGFSDLHHKDYCDLHKPTKGGNQCQDKDIQQ